MRGEIRGTLQGIAFFFGAIGTTLFALIGGIVFDNIAPWAPFVMISVADLTASDLTVLDLAVSDITVADLAVLVTTVPDLTAPYLV